jgi:hypothetical protein
VTVYDGARFPITGIGCPVSGSRVEQNTVLGGLMAREAVWASADGADRAYQHVIATPDELREPLRVEAVRDAVTGRLGAGGLLVGVKVTEAAGLPALHVVSKHPAGNGDLGCVAALAVPRRSVTVVLRVTCRGADRGRRELEVFARWVRDGGDPAAWCGAYRPGRDSASVVTPADQPCWDLDFPDHPLSRARRLLALITDGLRLAEDFRRLPPA